MKVRATRLLLASIVCAIPINLFAFEVGEIKSGMPQEEALQRLRAQGFKITQQKPSYFIAMRNRDARTAAFCNGRLVSFSYSVPGGVRGFIRRMSELSNQHGQGDVRASSSETDVGELNSLSATWIFGTDTLRVEYLVGSQRSSESQTVIWFTKSECSDRLK